jgi:hypothetical protein
VKRMLLSGLRAGFFVGERNARVWSLKRISSDGQVIPEDNTKENLPC